jgi:hypothetical protein
MVGISPWLCWIELMIREFGDGWNKKDKDEKVAV